MFGISPSVLRGAFLTFVGSLVGASGVLLYASLFPADLHPSAQIEGPTHNSSLAARGCEDSTSASEENVYFVSCGGLF